MSDEKKIRAFFEALADNVENLSDEELLAEIREEGRDPGAIATETRLLVQDTIKRFKQRALFAARQQHDRNEARLAALKLQLPTSPTDRRRLLDTAIARHKQAGRVLIAQYRDFKEMTDEDVESWLEQFSALGLLDDVKPESNE
jgi:hypothetical protein